MIRTQTIKLTKTKEIIFSAAFTALAVYAPMIVHYFGGVDAGRKFLPMPFFVLLAGLALGWRAGLVTAFASASISFLLTGMPKAELLPFVTLQLAAYGFLAGLLKKKYNAFISLAGAIIFGLLATGMVVFFFSKANAAIYVINALQDGYPGIAIQLILLPVLLKISRKYLFSAC